MLLGLEELLLKVLFFGDIFCDNSTLGLLNYIIHGASEVSFFGFFRRDVCRFQLSHQAIQ